MKIKLDENLGNRAIELFREAGHEVATVSEQELGGATDDELIEACRTERYAGIAVLRVPHPIDLAAIRERARVFLKASEQVELSGRPWIVEQNRIREYDPK